MGKLPEYQTNYSIRPPQDTGAMDRVATRLQGQNAIGGAIAGAGKTVQGIEDAYFEANLAETKLKTRQYINEKDTEFRRYFNEYSTIIEKQFADNPDGAIPSLQAEYDRKTKEMMKDAPNGSAKILFNENASKLMNGYISAARDWGIKKKISNFEQTNNDAAAMRATEVYRNPNPKALSGALAEVDVIADSFALTHDPTLVEKFKNNYRKNVTVGMFRGLLDGQNIKQAEALLKSKKYDEDLGADTISALQKEINRAKKARVAKQKDYSMLKITNPHSFFQKIGEKFSPMNPTDSQSVGVRLSEIEEKSKKYGIDPRGVSIFTPIERAYFDKTLSLSSPEEAQQIAWSMRSLPEDQFSKIARELSVNNPKMGVLMKLAQDGTAADQQTAIEILSGAQLMEKSVYDKQSTVVLPKDNDMELSLDKIMGGLGLGPLATRGLKQSMKALYAKEARDTGKNDGKWESQDDATMRKIFEKKFGSPFEWRGQKFLAEKRADGSYIAPERMSYILKNITNDVLEKTHGSSVYDNAGVQDIDNSVSRMRLFRTKGGYLITLDKNGEAGSVYLLDKNKKPFVLDIKKLDEGFDPGLVDTNANFLYRAMKYFMPRSGEKKGL